MQEWQTRVIAERAALLKNADALDEFINGDECLKLCPEGQAWLYIQAKGMHMYAEALDMRITHFKN